MSEVRFRSLSVVRRDRWEGSGLPYPTSHRIVKVALVDPVFVHFALVGEPAPYVGFRFLQLSHFRGPDGITFNAGLAGAARRDGERCDRTAVVLVHIVEFRIR